MMIGLIWQWDRLRPLAWAEYVYWMHHALPFGWSILLRRNIAELRQVKGEVGRSDSN